MTNLFSKHSFEQICGDQYVRAVFRLTNETATIQNDYNDVREYVLQIEKQRIFYWATSKGFKKIVKRLILKTLDVTKLRPYAKRLKNMFLGNS